MSEALREQLAFMPDYLGRHLVLTLSALATGIAISLPLGMFAAGRPRLRTGILGVASVIQTIPSLALLAFMVPLIGRIGFLPAFIALVLYSLLPVLRNTVTGLNEVDADVLEAARGIGMTPRQTLMHVQFPLALPVILAGVRTGTVWTVSIATLATPVGATSLGNYIFSGLTTQNYTAITLGCVAAALLALVLDGLLHLIERALTRRNLALGLIAGAGLAAVFAAGTIPILRAELAHSPGQRVVIGTKKFQESYILARVLADRLEARGLVAEVKQDLGSTVVFDATRQGLVDAYVDYSGTIWAVQMKEETNPGREVTLAGVTAWLTDEPGLCAGPALGFENRYALAMRRERAEALGIRSIEDLAAVANRLVIASDYEFFSRPEWTTVRDAYGMDFKEKRSMDPALMYDAILQDQVDVITAYTTDGRIAAYDLVLLDDPRQAFLPYDALVVLHDRACRRPRVKAALRELRGSISTEDMQAANKIVNVDGQPVSEAVDFLLKRMDGREN